MSICTLTGSQPEPCAKTILIVDDTPDNLRLLASLLSTQGYSVRLAPNGRLALMTIQQTLPDLILLDIRMPEISGYEVCQMLKADCRTRDIPIIFLSALQEGSDKAVAFDIGGADYITKPFQAEEVVARVRHQLQLLDLQQQLQQQQQLLLAQNQQLQQEISDRKRIESELKQEKMLLRSLIDAIPDLIFYKDSNGRYILWNQAFEHLIGLSADAIRHRTDADFFAPYAAQEMQAKDDQVLQGRSPLRYEEWMTITDRAHQLFEVYKVPIESQHGDPLGLIGICHDITQRKTNEQALLQTSQALTDFSNSLKQLHRLSISHFETSAELFQDYLRTGCQILNFSDGCICSLKDETYVLATASAEADAAEADSSAPERLDVAQLLCNKTVEAAHTLSHKSACALPIAGSAAECIDGEACEFGDRPVPWQSSLSAPIWVNGDVYGALCFFSDRPRTQGFAHHEQEIIELMAQSIGKFIRTRQVETEIHQAREIADAANHAKSEFLANISHELRTPLNAILGFTQLLLGRDDLDWTSRDYLSIVNRSGEHLLTLINDVLEMSKIEAGKVALRLQSFDLYNLLQTLEDMFSLRARAKNLSLRVERDAALPHYIEADESKLRQILINLLGNAVKFTQHGHVALRVSVTPSSEVAPSTPSDRSSFTSAGSQSLLLSFEVEDTGPGIAPDEVDSLFDPFVQTTAGCKSHEGTGLGLPISQRFAQLMGSDIRVQTALNQGSQFSFQINVQASALYHAKTQPLGDRLVERLMPGQPVYRLLVVEDHPANRMLLVQMFESVGFAVQVAKDGFEAIERAKAWQPHLIWMDIRMPHMDGYEATRQIKAAGLLPSPVIIALTAGAFEEERSRVLAAGCDDFVRKPFQASQVFQKIAQYLPVCYTYKPHAVGSSQGVGSSAMPVAIAPSHAVSALQSTLKSMPLSWLQTLQRAAILGSDQRILQLLDALPPDQQHLTQILADWATSFQFDALLELLESVKSNEGHREVGNRNMSNGGFSNESR